MLVPKINAYFSTNDAFTGIFSLLSDKSNIPVLSNIYYLNHARAGLRIAITALDLPKGSKIGITLYNCYTVMNAIRQAGHVIIFIDTTDDLRMDLDDLKEKHTHIDALIITHLFGLPNDMDEIKKICPLIPIIEDCAHSFSSSSNLYETGSIGDFAVFSIGLGKFPSIGEGGILKINNNVYSSRVNREIEQLNHYTLIDEIKLIFRLKITSIIYNPLIYKWISLPSKKIQHKRKKINSNYKHSESNMAKSVKYLYDKKFAFIDSYKLRQQKNAKEILLNLKDNKLINLPSMDLENNNCFMLPVLHPNREAFSKYLSKYGIEIAPHFTRSIEWAQEFGYETGSCINAEKIAKQILIIPIHYKLKNKYLRKLILGIKTYNSTFLDQEKK